MAPSVPRIGSPGQKNPAVERYDPTGLRSSMTANWANLDKELANIKPNHNVVPEWSNDIEQIWADCDKKGIPRSIGRFPFRNPPQSYNEIKW